MIFKKNRFRAYFLVGSLTLAGAVGLNYNAFTNNQTYNINSTINPPIIEQYLVDEDNDGIVDMLQQGGRVEWIKQGYVPKNKYYNTASASEMTPEMVKAATETKNAYNLMIKTGMNESSNHPPTEMMNQGQRALIAHQTLDNLILKRIEELRKERK